MSDYIDERNAHIRVLRTEIARRDGAHDPVRDALRWAVRRLEGLPEHWRADDGHDAAMGAWGGP